MSKKILVDSDIFVALVKKDDSNHKKATSLLQKLVEQPVDFFTTSYVFSESITVISMKIGYEEAITFIDEIKSDESKFVVERVDDEVEEMAIQIFKNQESKNTSFVDCINMAFIQKYKDCVVFSFDHVYRKNRVPMI